MTATGLDLVTGFPPVLALEETFGPPRFLDSPCANVPRSPTPVGCNFLARIGLCNIAFRYYDTVGRHIRTPFEAQSRGPLARRLRFAGKVTLAPRKTRYRPAG